MFKLKLAVGLSPLTPEVFRLRDITGEYPADATGYKKASYLPQGPDSWETRQIFVKEYAEDGMDLLDIESISPDGVNVVLNNGLYLGVNVLYAYYTYNTPDFSYSINPSDRSILTRVDDTPWVGTDGLFNNVHSINVDGNYIEVVSVTEDTVTLLTPIPDDYLDMKITYVVRTYVLNIKCLLKTFLQNLGDMNIGFFRKGNECSMNEALEITKINMLFNTISSLFDCGNYAKAHEGSQILIELLKINKYGKGCGC